MDKTEKRRFLFVSVFSLIAIMIVCGFAVAATNDGKIELNKTATKVYDGVDSSNQAYGKLAQVNLDVTAKSYIEGTVSKQLDVVLVVDGSGSMAYGPDGEWDYTGTPRIDSLIDTTYDFINEIMDTEGNVKLGLVEYGNSVKNTYDMTTDKKTALTYVDELTANGGTNLQSGIEKAHQLLDQGGRANVPKVVIILTDGVPTYFNHNGEVYGNGSNYDSVCVDWAFLFCTERKSPVEAAKEELDSLKNSYPTTDIYTITFGNEEEAAGLLEEINPESSDPVYSNLEAVTGEELGEIFDNIIEITQNIVGTNSVVTDVIPKEFELTDESQQMLIEKGIKVTKNTDGTTTLTWTIGNIEAEKNYHLSYEVKAKDDYHGSIFTNESATLKTTVQEENPYYEDTELSLEFDQPTVDIPATANDDHYRANPSYETYVGQAINGTSILTNDLNKNLIKDSNLLTGTISVEDRIVIVEDENTIKNVDGSYNLYKGGKDGTFLGNLKVNEDGTFTFQPKEGITGEVAFKYHIQTEITRLQNKSSVYSNDATVTLLIKESPKTEISGQKTWIDNDNQDGIRPDSITVRVIGTVNNEVVVSRAETVTATDGWSYEFTDLPLYETGYALEDEHLISYRVLEDSVRGYRTTYEGYNITNTHTPSQTSISGIKTWNDNNNQDGMRPESITVHLIGTANGQTVVNQSKTVTKTDGWSYSFEGLDEYYDGEEIDYTIREDEVTSYTGVVEGYNITNTHTPIKINIQGEKQWVDSNDKDGLRPDSVNIELTGTAKGTTVYRRTIAVTEAMNWKYEFKDLNKYYQGEEIQYTVKEEPVAYYETSYDEQNPFIIVNTHNSRNITISGTKTWVDDTNLYGRPDSITVILSGKIGSQEVVHQTKEVTADVNGEWNYEFTDLPEYQDGSLINYTIDEENVLDYDKTIDGYNIINTYNPETVTIRGAKVWDDNDNQDGMRPESITVHLLANGKRVATTTVTDARNWRFAFVDQVKYANGEPIVYTVEEESVEGYTTEIKDFTITNTHTPEKVSYHVQKIWNDNNNQDGIRPESITVHLLANGVEIASQVISESNHWEYTFENLDKYQNGMPIEYQIVEDEVKGYETNISDSVTEIDNNTTVVIENTHTPETIDITVDKVWDDDNNAYQSRPESITVHLYANGILSQTVTLTAENNWSYTFVDLAKYANGVEIEYTIVEEEVPGYTTTYNGYTITNTYKYKDNVGSTSGTSEITPPNTGVTETQSEDHTPLYLSGIALLALLLLKKRYEG